MSAGGGAGRAGVVAYLARHAMSWPVLHAYRHRGPAAAAEALGWRGGVGRDDDDVFRAWQTEAGGRRFTYREHSMDAPAVRVGLREVLDHIERRFDAAQWRRIDELVAARDAALTAYPTDHWRCARREHTPAEQAAIRAAGQARAGAERALDQLLGAALADEPHAGEQLDLFTDGTQTAQS